MRMRLKQGLRVRAARKLCELGAGSNSMSIAAWHPAAPELARAAARIEAKLYIAHYIAALPAAAAAAEQNSGLYAFDAEDFHLGETPESPVFDGERRLICAIESRLLPGAAYVTAASPEIADAYVETYGLKPPTVLLNVFPRAEAPKAPSAQGEASPGPSLYWFSQTIGPERGLECALRAIAEARSKPHLYLRGKFALGYDARLDRLARALNCRDRLHFLSLAPPSQMARLAAAYDVGLASEVGHTQNSERALSNKLFTYLLAGLPAVVSATLAQARFAEAKEACLHIYPRDDPKALASALDALLLDRDRLAQSRNTAFDLGQTRYNWDFEQRALLNVVGRALKPKDGRRVA